MILQGPVPTLIVGAAGRDFHDFLVLYRDDVSVDVRAFTAAQIPYIEQRRFPAELAGPRYAKGIPIFSQDRLDDLLVELEIRQVVFAYSDIANSDLMSLAARVTAIGADFVLPGARSMIVASKPVIGVGAVRTGCGKSQLVRYLLDQLKTMDCAAVGIRHPMPYGDLAAQAVQRFGSYDDFDLHKCTIEEREEYESYVERGRTVYAGVDYTRILAAAEREADLILWDGGNNDLPLIRPDLHLVILDPYRPGDTLRYYPSEAQLRLADVILINKSLTAPKENVEAERRLAERIRPGIPIIETDSVLSLDGGRDEGFLRGCKVVVVEDGPTTTHGGMKLGAATLLAERAGAIIVDPRSYFQGELALTYEHYPQLGALVPAMGYSAQQKTDLEATLNKIPADYILSASPMDLAALIQPNKPILRVRYDLAEIDGQPSLLALLAEFVERRVRAGN